MSSFPRGQPSADVYEASSDCIPGLQQTRARCAPRSTRSSRDWDSKVADGDEVAFIPPVSGGAHGVGVLFELTRGRSTPAGWKPQSRIKARAPICTFTGVVRDSSRGRSVTHLEYEAYEEMATAQMRKIADEIAEKWPEARVAMAHRTGVSRSASLLSSSQCRARIARRRSPPASGGSTGSRKPCRSGRRSTRPTARTGSKETKRSRSSAWGGPVLHYAHVVAKAHWDLNQHKGEAYDKKRAG